MSNLKDELDRRLENTNLTHTLSSHEKEKLKRIFEETRDDLVRGKLIKNSSQSPKNG